MKHQTKECKRKSLRNLWDNTKQSNIDAIETLEKEKEIGEEKIFEELMAPSWLILIQNFQPTGPRRSVNVKQEKHKITLIYIIVKLLKTKEKNLKSSQRKKVLYLTYSINSKNYHCFYIRNSESQKQQDNILKILEMRLGSVLST